MLKGKLNEGNLVKGINICTVSVMSYNKEIVKRSSEQLEGLNKMTRKQQTLYKVLILIWFMWTGKGKTGWLACNMKSDIGIDSYMEDSEETVKEVIVEKVNVNEGEEAQSLLEK